MNRQEEKGITELQWLCRSVLQNAFPKFQNKRIDACFYPYIGLTHTIRRKDAAWVIRISDHCAHAPIPVLEAIVMILGCKVMRRRPDRRFLRAYELFRRDPIVLEAVRARRLRKGRKHISGEAGKSYSLREIFREINTRYFNDQVEIGEIGWGLRKSWKRLGHYDPIHHSITLSPILDSPAVPRFVVSYIVYHEMLHALFEDPASHVRKHHPPEFQHAEKAYPDFANAKSFLKEFCGRRR